MAAGAGATDKQREAGGDDHELADLLPRRVPHLLQLLLLLPLLLLSSSHGRLLGLAAGQLILLTVDDDNEN
jgi:hypothetical protein